ncbi:hypothetical protein HBH69_036640 [Parastagonospora nodorum]|nr:hypothetical protein HBH46_071600 [Parastagonospora nodorum]KAH4267470.1 hypothetical protein HBI03_063660 [Parastagonospora nodorum]KAH4273092.1 hypothetical protein HBI04_133480 [Parastagonospora nodorum]KAH4921045.1 hypothetical protein HBI79_188700 [Parastagonospora nodorum]KAH5098888.1 hypothetical protein HBH72_111480 [Parastagonospora nodorum]
MDAERPNLLWTPELALRSKEQVLLEDWKAPNKSAASLKQMEILTSPAPADLTTWTTLKPNPAVVLFYQAHLSPPIPSMEEIDEATAKSSLHKDLHLHNVCRIGDTVIKCSASPDIIEEAENLLFLAQKRPKLRIPTVLAAWSTTSITGSAIYCLMMNFIEGIPLDHEEFAGLPIHAQNIICAKASSQLRYLRELPSEGYYGRVHKKGWLCPPTGLNSNTSSHRMVVGPYQTYEEYCAAVYRSSQVQKAASYSCVDWPSKHAELMARLISVFPGWGPQEPKLTWMDPKIANIIARQVEGDNGGEDWEVFLIDWECLGWYPAWLQGLQVDSCCNIMLRDPEQPSEFHPYRSSEIKGRVMKDFDPEPDWERIAMVHSLHWVFY